ncbi:MAG: hypothetical protein ACE5HT_15130 [Gemmatimonadales bacterium]
MVCIGERKIDAVRVDVIDYSQSRLNELRDLPADRCGELAKAPDVTWINVNGIHDVSLIQDLGKCLDWHPLTLEDIVNTEQRPKIEEFPGYVYVVLKMISFDEVVNQLEIEHVSFAGCPSRLPDRAGG